MGFLSPEKSGYHILNLSKFSKVFHITLWPEWEFEQRGPGLTGIESYGWLCWRLRLMRRGYWWKPFWSEKTTQQPKTPSLSDAGHHLYSSGWFTALSCQGGTSSSPSILVSLHFLVGISLLAPHFPSISLVRTLPPPPGYPWGCPLWPFLAHEEQHSLFFYTHSARPSLCLGWSCLRSISFFWELQSLDTSNSNESPRASLAGWERKTLRTTINLTSLFYVVVFRNILKTT